MEWQPGDEIWDFLEFFASPLPLFESDSIFFFVGAAVVVSVVVVVVVVVNLMSSNLVIEFLWPAVSKKKRIFGKFSGELFIGKHESTDHSFSLYVINLLQIFDDAEWMLN